MGAIAFAQRWTDDYQRLLVSERRKELESLTAEMKEQLAKIEAKLEKVESLRKQLGEIEDRLGVKPTAMK